MIIVNIKSGDNIERALKTLKSKVIKTKQTQKLKEKKQYTKKSVLKRTQILKAKYIRLIPQDFLILKNSFGQIFHPLIG
jgi:small subunit ribosomal protein S21